MTSAIIPLYDIWVRGEEHQLQMKHSFVINQVIFLHGGSLDEQSSDCCCRVLVHYYKCNLPNTLCCVVLLFDWGQNYNMYIVLD